GRRRVGGCRALDGDLRGHLYMIDDEHQRANHGQSVPRIAELVRDWAAREVEIRSAARAAGTRKTGGIRSIRYRAGVVEER
ncbi:MAG: hypothetical protein RLN75_02970, partial [Longimicrobiales bacterium]